MGGGGAGALVGREGFEDDVAMLEARVLRAFLAGCCSDGVGVDRGDSDGERRELMSMVGSTKIVLKMVNKQT